MLIYQSQSSINLHIHISISISLYLYISISIYLYISPYISIPILSGIAKEKFDIDAEDTITLTVEWENLISGGAGTGIGPASLDVVVASKGTAVYVIIGYIGLYFRDIAISLFCCCHIQHRVVH